jgi:hypothetical protein
MKKGWNLSNGYKTLEYFSYQLIAQNTLQISGTVTENEEHEIFPLSPQSMDPAENFHADISGGCCISKLDLRIELILGQKLSFVFIP